MQGTGYQAWVVLPSGPSAAAPASRPRLWSLEVEGEWNCIPGTSAPSLAHRLYCANLGAAGVGTLTVTNAEREAFLGPSAAQRIDSGPQELPERDRRYRPAAAGAFVGGAAPGAAMPAGGPAVPRGDSAAKIVAHMNATASGGAPAAGLTVVGAAGARPPPAVQLPCPWAPTARSLAVSLDELLGWLANAAFTAGIEGAGEGRPGFQR
jgi:hypothetical protein